MVLCTKCETEKSESEFWKGKRWCKVCKNAYEKERQAKNRDHINEMSRESYQKKKKDIEIEIDPDETKTCTLCDTEKSLDQFHFNRQRGCVRAECRDCASKQRKEYYKNHKAETVKKTSEYTKNKCKSDPLFKLERHLRSRVHKALVSQSQIKTQRTWKYLGCTSDFFQHWMIYQFNEKMTMENYGEVWHVDHVKPCASFDLGDEEQINECFSWKNCRPLLAEENLKKGDKIDKKVISTHEKTAQKFSLFWEESSKNRRKKVLA